MKAKRLIKDGDIILDGTGPRYEKEKEAFAKLERIEDIMEKYHLIDEKDLELRLEGRLEVGKQRDEMFHLLHVFSLTGFCKNHIRMVFESKNYDEYFANMFRNKREGILEGEYVLSDCDYKLVKKYMRNRKW